MTEDFCYRVWDTKNNTWWSKTKTTWSGKFRGKSLWLQKNAAHDAIMADNLYRMPEHLIIVTCQIVPIEQ